MITDEELEKLRSPKEFYKFVNDTFYQLKNSEERKIARKKKGNYKELIQELYPLSIFLLDQYFCTQIIA